MPYSDILNSINTFGTSYNYGDYQSGVNPYSSGAYINNNVREYQKTLAAPVDPRSPYSDYKISNEDRALKGLGYYGMGREMEFSNKTGNWLNEKTGGALFGKTSRSAKNFNLGNAALVYGLTRDGNPYKQTGLEKAGNIGSGALMGFQAGGPIGAFVGAIAGGGYSMWKQGDLAEKNEEMDIELQEDKDEYDDKINQFMSDNREHAQTLAESEMWAQQSAGYDNQYGGHLNSYGSSYYNKGGKLTPKEMKKVQSLGRNGDTQLAHINPQEAAMLKQMGGSGTINPYTGLREYGWLKDAGDWFVENVIYEGMEMIEHGIGTITELPALISGNMSWENYAQNRAAIIPYAGIEDSFDRNDRLGISGEAIYNDDGQNIGYDFADGYSPYDSVIYNDTYDVNGNTTYGRNYIMDDGSSYNTWGQETTKTPSSIPYQAGVARDPRGVYRANRNNKLNNSFKVTNPFGSFQNKDKENSGSDNLEGYRWDMANPYIRENVDIFDDGGVVDTTDSLPMDSLLNRQVYKESAFIPTAESDAGAAGLTQITPDTFKFFQDKGWVPRGNDQVKRAKALAAYNMGPTKLVNKLNELKKKGVDIYNNTDWINELNAETSDYINKILLGNNPDFEADYTTEYNKTGKNYANGGMVDAIAEFTGNELIINNQNQVELGLKEKDYAKAAAPIKDAMKKGFVTPGPETHQGNPMPVGQDGSIYAGGGKLPFKVRKGAGVYDHATDQFKEGMSDEEIAMVAQENINKWKSNNMA